LSGFAQQGDGWPDDRPKEGGNHRMNELDEKDRLLLAALRADARQSLVELARHTALYPQRRA
jgi:hypothetical protein